MIGLLAALHEPFATNRCHRRRQSLWGAQRTLTVDQSSLKPLPGFDLRPQTAYFATVCRSIPRAVVDGIWRFALARPLDYRRGRSDGVPQTAAETLMPSELSRDFISFPVLKKGTAFRPTKTNAPVRGFLPVRASRNFAKKLPNPRSSTRSPRAIAAVISAKMVLTIFSQSRR